LNRIIWSIILLLLLLRPAEPFFIINPRNISTRFVSLGPLFDDWSLAPHRTPTTSFSPGTSECPAPPRSTPKRDDFDSCSS
jgi:hypothetical protein